MRLAEHTAHMGAKSCVEDSTRTRKKIPHEGIGGADLHAVLTFKNTWLQFVMAGL